MAIFKGRYSWDGKKNDQREPIAWFPGTYDLKIVDLAEGKKGNVSETSSLYLYKYWRRIFNFRTSREICKKDM